MTDSSFQHRAPGVGDPAPDLTLLDDTSEERMLSYLWTTAGSGRGLVFLRHFC